MKARGRRIKGDREREKEEPREKETEGPPHRRNNLSASVSRPRERLCMIYSRIRRSAGRARERKREGTRARDAGEQVERVK